MLYRLLCLLPARFCALLLSLLLSLLPNVAVQAQTSVMLESAAVSRLETLLGGIETFQADVRQLITESSGGVLEESIIRFKLKRPNGFYWETLEPYPELIVTNGQQLWNYQPDLLQVTIEPWDASQSELAAQLLNGRIDEIRRDYLIEGHSVRDGEAWEFFLTPVDDSSLYERVTLYFRGERLDSIHVDSGNGQRTLWEFFNHKFDEPLGDEEFRFTPPDDVEVIDNTAQ